MIKFAGALVSVQAYTRAKERDRELDRQIDRQYEGETLGYNNTSDIQSFWAWNPPHVLNHGYTIHVPIYLYICINMCTAQEVSVKYTCVSPSPRKVLHKISTLLSLSPSLYGVTRCTYLEIREILRRGDLSFKWKLSCKINIVGQGFVNDLHELQYFQGGSRVIDVQI